MTYTNLNLTCSCVYKTIYSFDWYTYGHEGPVLPIRKDGQLKHDSSDTDTTPLISSLRVYQLSKQKTV